MKPASPLRLALLIVELFALLAPASRRTTWRQQWRADLWHYDRWLARERTAPAAHVLSLLARASGAPVHAISLRLHDWSPCMLVHDLKFGWRMFVRRPAFTAVAVMILGLGIGANATIFSWVESVLLTPLSGVPAQEGIVVVRGVTTARNNLSMSYPNFVDLRAAKPDGLQDVIWRSASRQ